MNKNVDTVKGRAVKDGSGSENEAYNNVISTIGQLSEYILRKQNVYINAIVNNIDVKYKSLSYVITPDMLTYHNYMHAVIKSTLKDIPLDLCTDNGGYMCTNIKNIMSPIGPDETSGGEIIDRSSYTTLANSFDINVPKQGILESGENEVLKSAINILDGIQVNTVHDSVDVRDEFIDNLSTIGGIFNGKLKEFQSQLIALNNELIMTRKDLRECKSNSDSAGETGALLAQINRLKGVNQLLEHKYNESELYRKTLLEATRKDIEALNGLTSTLNDIRDKLYNTYDERLKSLNNVLARFVDDANRQNGELMERLRQHSSETEADNTRLAQQRDQYLKRQLQEQYEQQQLQSTYAENELRKDNVNLREMMTELQESLKQSRSEVDSLKAYTGTLQSNLKLLRSTPEVGVSSTRHATRLNAAKNTIDELNNEIAELKRVNSAGGGERENWSVDERAKIIEMFEQRILELISFKTEIYSVPGPVYELSDMEFLLEDSVEIAFVSKIIIQSKYIDWANNSLVKLLEFVRVAEAIVVNRNREIAALKNVLEQSHIPYRRMLPDESDLVLRFSAEEMGKNILQGFNLKLKDLNDTMLIELIEDRNKLRQYLGPLINELVVEYKSSVVESQMVNQTGGYDSDALKQKIRVLKNENKQLNVQIITLGKYADLWHYLTNSSNTESVLITNINELIAENAQKTQENQSLKNDILLLQAELANTRRSFR